MADLTVQSQGPAQTLSLVLPSESIKPVVHLLIILIVALFVTLPPSIYAIVMVTVYTHEQDKKIYDLEWRDEQVTYWAQTLDAQVEAHGLKPNVPFPVQALKQKEKPK